MVITFYSFKGGVGRTMALVQPSNFHLEAPGLADILRSRESLASGQAPEVDRFIGESPGIGDIWIMPSGAHHKSYATHFSQIDWAALYEQHDGYLLFEDLKAQWKQVLKPDYVLIDSRTGHTDTHLYPAAPRRGRDIIFSERAEFAGFDQGRS